MVLTHPFNSEIMKKIISFLCIYLFTILAAQAQTYDYTSFKEKIYIHTSHVFFQPGDEMFFKLYLVNAKDQQPSSLSRVAFVDILDPSGKVFKKLSYRITDGYAEGSFYFEPSVPGGIYRLKAYTSWMRNENDSTFYTKEVTVQQVIPPRVLMKLDFPKKGYGPGDEVTADYTIRNLSDQPIAGHAVNYKISIGGTVIQTGKAVTGGNGKVQLQFRLPADLSTTDGLLNVTIDYDAYKESISRSIPIVLNKIDLQLLPEGGALVAGLTSNIAFRAVNEHGKPADIKGVVLDHAGRQVSAFESYYAGMGKFSFTPLPGEKYTVRIISPLHISQVYDFPACRSEGVVMNFIKKDGKFQLELSAMTDQQVTLTGQTKAVTYYTKVLQLKKGTQAVDIDESLFPAGIARFTLLLRNKTPVAERLVFLNRNKIMQVSITTDKKEYLPREKVKMTIKTMDDKGTPLPSNLSVAVMDDKLWTYADDKQDHILSWLLMSSELRGKIEEPLFYFREDEPKAGPALDLVMLTHGYRYFDYIPQARNGELLRYIPDEGQVLSGTVLNAEKKPVQATVFLINTGDNGKAIQMNTDDDGTFFFTNLDPLGRYCLIARPVKKRELVTIRIEQHGVELNEIRARKLLEKGVVLQPAVQPLPVVPGQKEDADAVMNMVKIEDAKALEEVIVVGYGVEKKRSVTGALKIYQGEDIEGNKEEILNGRVAGLAVLPAWNPGGAEDIRIRGNASLTGNNQPLFVVDGVVMEGLDMQLSPNDIASIEVIKDMAATAIYGTRGANGVIVIHTKNKLPGRIRFNLGKRSYYATAAVPPSQTSFSVARRFFAPHYATTDTEERTDFRETIYWNPVVQTDKEGMATVEFYNSDAATTFRAVAEGIAWNGKPGRAEATWSARNVLQIDAKIPPYLTIGDQAMVPLVLKNNGASAIQLDISIAVPVNMSAGRFENKVTLEPNGSRQVLVPLEAVAPTSGTVKFTVHGKGVTETLSLPIAAAQRGFPVIHTFSGETSAQHSFQISEPVKGSIQTRLQVFTSLEGQLLDGIESMLREPYGCFEQTSSSTYPNIFILKYLKESGKSNREVEAKALEYIEAGYKRLIGFETAMGGFEWFGHTPPHEALTAYGLLEFTDMQAFIDVDKSMLARTKSFLLNRRDGEGGFKLSAGGYDKFRSVPGNIANLYIVYALTQAGVGGEIQREYNAGMQKALASNDGYQLGLMALAASNMKDTTNYHRLMAALKESYRKENLAAATSVVNSRDASLRVEALSLYAMALAREQHPDMAAIAIAISKILSEKVYYGYGSTQATVLALNAIVECVKLKGRAESNGVISFHLNNEPLEAGQASSHAVKTGINTFAVEYGDHQPGLPYNMELSYFTMQPPGSAAAELQLYTALSEKRTKAGETVRMNIEVKNIKSTLQPMAIAKIGIPAGLSLQPWQLKELAEKKEVAYYEIFDNYLVLYWMGFAAGETKSVRLDLKADVPGKYKGKASNCYLYYTPEHKHWQEGTAIEIAP